MGICYSATMCSTTLDPFAHLNSLCYDKKNKVPPRLQLTGVVEITALGSMEVEGWEGS